MIDRCRDAFPIRMMCERLGVSPSGYYEWRKRPPSPRTQANARLLARIEALYSASDGVLGRRRICDDYQRFLKGHNLVYSMSAAGSSADNALVEGFIGMLKRERVNRRSYFTRAEARADIFDYIERFYNPRMKRKLAKREQDKSKLNSTVHGIGVKPHYRDRRKSEPPVRPDTRPVQSRDWCPTTRITSVSHVVSGCTAVIKTYRLRTAP